MMKKLRPYTLFVPICLLFMGMQMGYLIDGIIEGKPFWCLLLNISFVILFLAMTIQEIKESMKIYELYKLVAFLDGKLSAYNEIEETTSKLPDTSDLK